MLRDTVKSEQNRVLIGNDRNVLTNDKRFTSISCVYFVSLNSKALVSFGKNGEIKSFIHGSVFTTATNKLAVGSLVR